MTAHVAAASSIHCEVTGPARSPFPLSWPQRHIWRVVQAIPGTPSYGSLYLTGRPRPGTRVGAEDAVATLAGLVQRHEVLRTSVVRDGGEVYQAVAVHRLADPSGRAAPWSLVGSQHDGGPVGAAVLIDDQDLTSRLVVRVDHLNTDEWGLRLLETELSAALSGEPARGGVQQPVDVVSWETSDEGELAQRSALAFIRRQLMAGPQTMFPYARDARTPRFWIGRLRSRALAAALTTLVARHRVTASGIVTAAFAAEVARWAGTAGAIVYVLATNRQDRRSRGYSGPMVQEVPLSLEVAGRAPVELIRDASAGTLEAFRHARADPRRFDDLLDTVGRQRREPVDRMGHAVVVNFHQTGRLDERLRCTGAQLRALRPASRFLWTAQVAAENVGLLLDATVAGSEATLVLRLDTSLIGPDEAESLLWGAEERIVQLAATADVTPG
jgi:hypothetical protein